MIRIPTCLVALTIASAAIPVAAQQYYSTEVVPPKITKMGTHTSPVAGTGIVRVQVQINRDGTHHVTRIISSTNHGDDAAAREIAETSTYRPAMRGGKAVVYLYDPVFKFTGKSVANVAEGGSVASIATGGGGGSIDAMLRSGRYQAAKSAAQSGLTRNPNDGALLQQLGAADYYLKDYEGSADAFNKVARVSSFYSAIAAGAFAQAAVDVSTTNPQQSLDYARKAVSLNGGANSRFALGVAQLANKQYTDAIATLQSVRSTLATTPNSSIDARYGVDQRLMMAYMGANETSQAQSLAGEMKRLRPSSSPYQAICVSYLSQGNDQLTLKNYDQAIALYLKMTAFPDTECQTAGYTRSANVIASEVKPDPTVMKGYADKALAANANDAAANFFEGYALALQYNASHSAQLKQQALTYLNKADTLAKASTNQQMLVPSIENLIKQLNGSGGGMSP
jgi:hypothetical protein